MIRSNVQCWCCTLLYNIGQTIPFLCMVPDFRVAMEFWTINDWFLIKVNYRDFCLGNIIELMKSGGGVLRKTILTSGHFEEIYPIIILGTFSIILSPNVQCTINILQNGYLNLRNWLLITFAIVNIYFFFNPLIFKHLVPPSCGWSVAGPVQSSDSPMVIMNNGWTCTIHSFPLGGSQQWMDATVGIYVLLSYCRAEYHIKYSSCSGRESLCQLKAVPNVECNLI